MVCVDFNMRIQSQQKMSYVLSYKVTMPKKFIETLSQFMLASSFDCSTNIIITPNQFLCFDSFIVTIILAQVTSMHYVFILNIRPANIYIGCT